MGATPDQLKSSIERTRAELAADVDALGDRVSPTAVARRRVDSVRAGATGIKERVMGTAGSASTSLASSASSAAGSAVGSVSSAAGTVGATSSRPPPVLP